MKKPRWQDLCCLAAALVFSAAALGAGLASAGETGVFTERARAAQTAAPSASPVPAGPLDLNAAAAWELELLPGIGEKRAAAIVAWREANGPFRDIEELMEVPGIGPGIFGDVKNYIRVGGQP